jgi:transcriptional regulator with XRE-family HTH domain
VRVAKGIAQVSFATVSSMSHVSRIERGTSVPTLGKIEALAEVMDVHPMTVLALSYMASPQPKALQALFERIASEIEGLELEKFSDSTLTPGAKPKVR